MKTLCLVMIIRSDAHGLGNCLESVKGLVDRWIVCGSGTARDTRQTIEQAMDGIPGDFHDLEWVNFGANRTRAMELAAGKADYHLVLDANMVVRYKREFRHELEADSYLVQEEGTADCWVERIFSDRQQWRYVGSVREVPLSTSPSGRARLPSLRIACQEDESSRVDRLSCEIELLKESLERGASVPRATFYLARAYQNLGNLPRAVEYYEARLTMGGWDEELW